MLEEKDFNVDLGQKIRECRRIAGLTQLHLANRMGLSRTSITNIEKGNQKLSLFSLYSIALELGVNVQELLPNFNLFKEAQTKDKADKNTAQTIQSFFE